PFYEDPRLGNLAFEDTPVDPCLPGFQSPLLVANCFGQRAPVGSYLGFTTTLVGVGFDAQTGYRLISLPSAPSFAWRDTFNGLTENFSNGTGGITCTGGVTCTALSNHYAAVPGSGSGGVTISSINGVAVGALTSGQKCNGVFDGTFNGNVTVSADQNCT